jgi:hypothetical protein
MVPVCEVREGRTRLLGISGWLAGGRTLRMRREHTFRYTRGFCSGSVRYESQKV